MSSKTRYEPWQELPEKNLRKINALTEAMHKATDSIEYNLATDTIKVPGQNWACVSFVSPSGNQKCGSIGMKIRGVFDQQHEATEYVKRLIRLDPTFDIYVCDMYNWCLVPPDPEHVGNQTYQDETLNTIISEYHKNQIYAKEHFEERKRELMEQAADEARSAALKRIEEQDRDIREEPIVDKLVKTVIEDNFSGQLESTSLESTNLESEPNMSVSDIMDSMVNGEFYKKV